jgi:hypothetical protein
MVSPLRKGETFKTIAHRHVLKSTKPFKQKAACKFKKLAAFLLIGINLFAMQKKVSPFANVKPLNLFLNSFPLNPT